MTAPKASDLFASAASIGTIDDEALSVLNGFDLTAGINDALGTPIETLKRAETLNVLIIVDDSSSIADARNTKNVVEGVNLILDAITGSKSACDCLACIMALNSGLISPFAPIESVPRLDTSNYRPYGNTPLFKRTLEGFGAMLAKVEECRMNGVAARGIIVIVTDGADNGRGVTPDDVKALASSLIATESHLIYGIGIDDGVTDFRAVFQSMGLRDDLIRTPKNTAKEIRADFALVSRSSAAASQGAGGFSQVFGSGL